MRLITTIRASSERIYEGGPIRLYITVAYSIQYSKMMYRFVG